MLVTVITKSRNDIIYHSISLSRAGCGWLYQSNFGGYVSLIIIPSSLGDGEVKIVKF